VLLRQWDASSGVSEAGRAARR